MAEALPKEQGREDKKQKLQSAVDKLQRDIPTSQKEYGLGKNFRDEVKTESEALTHCERAMEALSTSYVEQLECFRDSRDSLTALKALEESEACWKKEASLIHFFDQEGGESEFLYEMRYHAFEVIATRLEQAARDCHEHPDGENVALCLAILGVLDHILDESGVHHDNPQRARYRDIAQNFQLKQ